MKWVIGFWVSGEGLDGVVWDCGLGFVEIGVVKI